jgi:hypothetical protein
MQESGSRRVMANPGTGDNCANATAAMRLARRDQAGKAGLERRDQGCRCSWVSEPGRDPITGGQSRESNHGIESTLTATPSPCGEGEVELAQSDYFFSAAARLHSERNFLRSLP